MNAILQGALRALQMAGAAEPAVEALVTTFLPMFGDQDQATLKEALVDAQAENDEGHARLQSKLDAAIAAGDA